MSTHTPGPWKVEEYDAAMGGKRYEVSTLVDGKWTRVTQPMESEQNARLIAAAPRMLDALRDAVKSLEYAVKVLQAPEASAMREGLAEARAILRDVEGESNG